jgi:hypothetical protein
MVSKIQAGDLRGAADIVVSQPGFIDKTMFYFGDSIRNMSDSPSGQYNAFVAFFQGVARDNKPIKELFSDGLYYVSSAKNQNS